MQNNGVPKEVFQTLLVHRNLNATEIYANWVQKVKLILITGGSLSDV